MASVTIHHLEVRFHVEGDDNQVFTALFAKHIRAWQRAYEDECARRRQLDTQRGYGDRAVGR